VSDRRGVRDKDFEVQGLMAPIPVVARFVLGFAALALLVPGWVSDLIGLTVAGVVIALLLFGKVGRSNAA